MITAVSPRVRERLSVVMVRVTLQDVSPSAMAIAVAMDSARYLMAFMSRCFWVLVSFIILEFRCSVVQELRSSESSGGSGVEELLLNKREALPSEPAALLLLNLLNF